MTDALGIEAPDTLSGEYSETRWLPLDVAAALAWKRNPKLHDIQKVATSIQRYGFRDKPAFDANLTNINNEKGAIVFGNGRIEALVWLHTNANEIPRGIRYDVAGNWYVPVEFGLDADSEAQAEAFGIDHNAITLGGAALDFFDQVEMFEGKSLAVAWQAIANAGDSLVSYDANDLDTLLKALGGQGEPGEGAEAQTDRLAEIHARWGAKEGDLWTIASLTTPGLEHRVTCGDSTDPAVVERLFANVPAPVLLDTDPLYGVDYHPEWREEVDKTGATYAKGKVLNDDRIDWSDAYRLFPGDVAYVWHAGIHAAEVAHSLEASGFEVVYQIIWKKNNMVFGRGDYHWSHEPCWYVVRKGKKHNWQGSRRETTVWEIAGMNPADKNTNEEDSRTGHSTQKPIECMRKPILNNTERGDAVYDPFLGSGTTIVAAETVGRVAYGVELNPLYVSLTLQRLEDMGMTPKLVGKDKDPAGAES